MEMKMVDESHTYRTEIYGNVVRKVQVEAPQRRTTDTTPVEVPKKKNRVKQDAHSIRYCMILGVICAFTLLIGVFYLQQQAVNTKSQKTIAKLEGDLAELKKQNADELNRIETSVNLEEIRDIAMNELGMIYATEENVVLYENTRHNYVSQYEEVPQTEKSLLESIINTK